MWLKSFLFFFLTLLYDFFADSENTQRDDATASLDQDRSDEINKVEESLGESKKIVEYDSFYLLLIVNTF